MLHFFYNQVGHVAGHVTSNNRKNHFIIVIYFILHLK